MAIDKRRCQATLEKEWNAVWKQEENIRNTVMRQSTPIVEGGVCRKGIGQALYRFAEGNRQFLRMADSYEVK